MARPHYHIKESVHPRSPADLNVLHREVLNALTAAPTVSQNERNAKASSIAVECELTWSGPGSQRLPIANAPLVSVSNSRAAFVPCNPLFVAYIFISFENFSIVV